MGDDEKTVVERLRKQATRQAMVTWNQWQTDCGDGAKKRQVKLLITADQALRFLRTCQHDEPAALERSIEFILWREAEGIDRLKFDRVINEWRTGKVYHCGHDRAGNPLLVVRPAFHYPSQVSVEETMLLGTWLIDRMDLWLSKKYPPGTTVSLLWDRDGVGWSNVDWRFLQVIKRMVDTYGRFYAERMGKVLILKPNAIFHHLWSVVSAFLNEPMRQKIVLVSDLDALHGFVAPDQLEERYGGTLVPKVDPTLNAPPELLEIDRHCRPLRASSR